LGQVAGKDFGGEGKEGNLVGSGEKKGGVVGGKRWAGGSSPIEEHCGKGRSRGKLKKQR